MLITAKHPQAIQAAKDAANARETRNAHHDACPKCAHRANRSQACPLGKIILDTVSRLESQARDTLTAYLPPGTPVYYRLGKWTVRGLSSRAPSEGYRLEALEGGFARLALVEDVTPRDGVGEHERISAVRSTAFALQSALRKCGVRATLTARWLPDGVGVDVQVMIGELSQDAPEWARQYWASLHSMATRLPALARVSTSPATFAKIAGAAQRLRIQADKMDRLSRAE
ncbi:hypothetical protein ACIBH1_45305 [Nonomuraea sp. NPDC050663]|uniref:hypothetical protein n=1 Tax=Nonomuraea sp. NPDC050663 TaxID=3364370 RepID=UPI0037A7410D